MATDLRRRESGGASRKVEITVEAHQTPPAEDDGSECLLQAILEHACTVAAADGACIQLCEGDLLSTHAALGSLASIAGLRMAQRGAQARIALDTRRPHSIADADHLPLHRRDAVAMAPARSLVSIPLIDGDEAIGVVNLVSERVAAFTDAHLAALEGVAAIAVQSLRMATDQRRQNAEREELLSREHQLASELRLILESTGEGICGITDDQRITFINSAGARMLGYEPDELVGRKLHDTAHHSVRDGSTHGIETCHVSQALLGVSCHSEDDIFWRRDGSFFPVEYWGHPIDGGGPHRAVVTFADITARSEADETLIASLETLQRSDRERQRLLGRLVRAQEEERARIAGDIHDDSVQVMAAVGLRLASLRRRMPDPELASRFQTLEAAVQHATERLRHLLFELRPRALDSEGLAAALTLYLDQMTPEAGLLYTLDNRLPSEPPTDVRVVLYRLAQESLTNIRKHARATAVTLILTHVRSGVEMSVIDNGVGIPDDALAHLKRPGHLGLIAMRERAETAGGTWTIQRRLEGGTEMTCWIPCEEHHHAPGDASA